MPPTAMAIPSLLAVVICGNSCSRKVTPVDINTPAAMENSEPPMSIIQPIIRKIAATALSAPYLRVTLTSFFGGVGIGGGVTGACGGGMINLRPQLVQNCIPGLEAPQRGQTARVWVAAMCNCAPQLMQNFMPKLGTPQ